jgi:hypothetical protein
LVYWKRALLHYLCQSRFHGVGSELITVLVRVQEVGHNVFRDFAIGAEEHFVDVEEADVLAIIELSNGLVIRGAAI